LYVPNGSKEMVAELWFNVGKKKGWSFCENCGVKFTDKGAV